MTEIEKVKQNEKTEEYVSNEGTRKKPEKDHNETEINNLSDKECKTILIRILIEQGKRIGEHCENFNKELENITKAIRAKKVH